MSIVVRCSLLFMLVLGARAYPEPHRVFITSPDNCRGTAALAPDHRCGPDFEFKRCPIGECCGKDGKCSANVKVCTNEPICPVQKSVASSVDNCKGKPSRDRKCGPDYGFTRCDAGECCTQDGRCGKGPEFCTNSLCPAQNVFRVVFDNAANLLKTSSNCMGVLSTTRSEEGVQYCGPKHNFMHCPYDHCCNKNGKCDTDPKTCKEPHSICPRQPNTGKPEFLYGEFVAPAYDAALERCRAPQRANRFCGPMNDFGSCRVDECCDSSGRCNTGGACMVNALCPKQPKPVPSLKNCRGVRSTHDNLCGPHNNFMSCDKGECCSFDGFCGSTDKFCNAHSVCPKQGEESAYKPVEWVL
uniref:Chitin-binding type-1 domain-containing protein n=1 Tax=Spongospora subterranea TaxID=70186 RepID=A0A0H5RLN6_9EUKA|eukprot:CRZ09644.1 hypothetical protein [Spongospora subterranea]